MTGNKSLLKNFVERFMGTVRFGNNHFAPILGYGNIERNGIVIKRVHYVEGLSHNLFSVGQFCDNNLQVLFRQSLCKVQTLDGVDILCGERGDNLFTVNLNDNQPTDNICLVSKATSKNSWLWHRRLSHLNFQTVNGLVNKQLVEGLPDYKYESENVCPSCAVGKIKRTSHKLKKIPHTLAPLHLIHMDLCGPMKIQSRNGKKYILVIVDDFSRYTWVKFLASKDETTQVLIDFITTTQVNLQLPVRYIRSDNGTEFKNAVFSEFCKSKGITHQFSAARTPQQNGVVERRNRTLVEAARTMLAYSKLPSNMWAEAVDTACHTQNRSIINQRHDKTPYEVINKHKPNINYFRIFGCVCYTLNDKDNVGKFEKKGDEGYFVGYSKSSIDYRIYNRKTNTIQETMNVWFDEMSGMIFEQEALLPSMSDPSVQRASILASKFKKFPTPTSEDLDILFEEFYNSHPNQSNESQIIDHLIPNNDHIPEKESVPEVNNESTSNPLEQEEVSRDIYSEENNQDHPFRINQTTNPSNTPSVYVPLDFDHPDFEERVLPSYDTMSQQNSGFHDDDADILHQDILPHDNKWSRMRKDHPTEQIIGNPQAGVSTRTSVNECLVALSLSNIEPKSVPEALSDPEWVKAMQDELAQFERLKVWRLVPNPRKEEPIGTKWIFKNKKDENGVVVRNKARLVAKGYCQQPGVDFDESTLR